MRGRLGAVRASTLVIAGDSDPAATLDQAKRIRDGIPAADLLVVEDAAHLANVEQPETAERGILDHLRPVTGGAK